MNPFRVPSMSCRMKEVTSALGCLQAVQLAPWLLRQFWPCVSGASAAVAQQSGCRRHRPYTSLRARSDWKPKLDAFQALC